MQPQHRTAISGKENRLTGFVCPDVETEQILIPNKGLSQSVDIANIKQNRTKFLRSPPYSRFG